jgi:hypothetical protein
VEAFDYKCETFIKITRLFEDIYREMVALIRNLWDILKDFEAFQIRFQKCGGFR